MTITHCDYCGKPLYGEKFCDFWCEYRHEYKLRFAENPDSGTSNDNNRLVPPPHGGSTGESVTYTDWFGF